MTRRLSLLDRLACLVLGLATTLRGDRETGDRVPG